MKALIVALLTAACVSSAADITLPDGRIFREAKIVSQSPTTVTIRHATGFDQVPKSKLPTDLAEQYPTDTAAAEQEAAASEKRAAATATAQAAKAERIRASASRAPQPKPPAPAAASFEFPPKLNSPRDRWLWRTKPLTIGPGSRAPVSDDWRKIVDFCGGRRFRQHIDLPPGIWRVSVTRQFMGRENSWGNQHHTSVIVTAENGAKLACSVDCATVYGNVSGSAVIDGETVSGTISVVLECAEYR